jgi:hypothetical protein
LAFHNERAQLPASGNLSVDWRLSKQANAAFPRNSRNFLQSGEPFTRFPATEIHADGDV